MSSFYARTKKENTKPATHRDVLIVSHEVVEDPPPHDGTHYLRLEGHLPRGRCGGSPVRPSGRQGRDKYTSSNNRNLHITSNRHNLITRY